MAAARFLSPLLVVVVAFLWAFRNLPPTDQVHSTHAATMSTTSDVVSKLFTERGSIREYAKTPVPGEVVAELLRLTQRAPTAFNTQPYVAIILRSEDDRAHLAPAMLASNQAKVTSAPLVVVFAADLEPSKGVPRLQELMRAGGAPEGMVNFLPMYLNNFSGEGTDKGLGWSYKQTSIAAATFLYAAAAHGLATCPMEGFDQEAVKKALELPDRYSVPIIISVGYTKDGVQPRVSGRLPPAEVLFEGKLGGSTTTLFEKP